MAESQSGAFGLLFMSFSFVLSAWNSRSEHPSLEICLPFPGTWREAGLVVCFISQGPVQRHVPGDEQLPLEPVEWV